MGAPTLTQADSSTTATAVYRSRTRGVRSLVACPCPPLAQLTAAFRLPFAPLPSHLLQLHAHVPQRLRPALPDTRPEVTHRLHIREGSVQVGQEPEAGAGAVARCTAWVRCPVSNQPTAALSHGSWPLFNASTLQVDLQPVPAALGHCASYPTLTPCSLSDGLPSPPPFLPPFPLLLPREYTDATFTVPKPVPPYQGLTGPLLLAEVRHGVGMGAWPGTACGLCALTIFFPSPISLAIACV